MRLNDTARVGLAVLIAIALLAGVNLWLSGALHPSHTYLQKVRFANAQGIEKGASVRVQGVDMGTVADVGLAPDRQAVLTLRINDSYQVQPNDAIRIVGSLVGFTPPFVEITPGGRSAAATPGPGGALPGTATVSQDEILSRSNELLGNLNQLSQRMNRLTDSFQRVVDDPKLRGDLSRTADNFAKVSDSGVVIARNMQEATGRATRLIDSFQATSRKLDTTLRKADTLFASLNGTAKDSQALMRDTRGMIGDARQAVGDTRELIRNTTTTVKNANGLVTDARTFAALNREKLQDVVNTLDSSLKQLNATLADARSFVADPQLKGDLKQTAENVKAATENLKAISADVRSITGDRQVQEDLKSTVANLRDATEQAATLFRKVRGVVGGSGRTAKTVGQRISDMEIRTDLVHTTGTDRTRLDFDATIPWSNRTFYRVGLFDFGERNRFNLQAGQQLRSGIWSRYGIHQSKLGGGLDFGTRTNPFLSVDLFGINEPRADVRGNIPLTSFLDLTVGVDNIFRGSDPLVGVRYHSK